jgi:transketolase
MMFTMDQYSNRVAFGNAVCRVMGRDENVVALAGDTGKSMGFGPAEKAYPRRALNVGIAEQNMINMAAGLASLGYLVFATSHAPFATMRVLEQIRTFLCYPKLNVKIAGGIGGLSAGEEGATHQGFEDAGLMRILPNMTVLVPADCASTEVITEELAKHNGPAYLKLGKNAFPKIFDADYQFELGKANYLREGADVTIICNGIMVHRTLMAAEQLANEGIQARILEMPCIKPLDVEAVVKCASDTGAIVTAEDHTIIGGLGSAVAETLSGTYPTPVVRVGLQDVFAQSGAYDVLLDHYGMAVADLVEAAKQAMRMKQ